MLDEKALLLWSVEPTYRIALAVLERHGIDKVVCKGLCKSILRTVRRLSTAGGTRWRVGGAAGPWWLRGACVRDDTLEAGGARGARSVAGRAAGRRGTRLVRVPPSGARARGSSASTSVTYVSSGAVSLGAMEDRGARARGAAPARRAAHASICASVGACVRGVHVPRATRHRRRSS